MLIEHFYGALVENPTIHDAVFDLSSPATILSFARTHRFAREIVKSYMARVFNINHHLSRFFFSEELVLSFRSLQARTGTLISGSNALQFLDRTFYEDSDLDLYCEGRYAGEAGFWLQDHADYEFRPNSSQQGTFEETYVASMVDVPEHENVVNVWEPSTSYSHLRGVNAVFNFFKQSANGGRELKIQLLSSQLCAMEVIINFHSTAVINVISFAAAYSLFPRATFVDRRSLTISTAGPRQEPAREKYKSRGFSMVASPSSFERQFDRSSFREGTRWIGDSLTWTLPLDVSNVHIPSTVSGLSMGDGLSITRWELKYNSSLEAEIQFLLVSSSFLKFSYLAPETWEDNGGLSKIFDSMRVTWDSISAARKSVSFLDSELALLCKDSYSLQDRCNHVYKLIQSGAA